MSEEIKKQEIKIEIDEQTANGTYSNLALITHSETEFVIDFIFVQPQNGKAKVRSRIVTSPLHAKKVLEALKENIAKYETRFGEVKTPEIPIVEKSKFYN
ncbi:MAG: DUF3467 domain-containing protein [Endomicrobiaceae bacterium]|jgi:hypothetical protein|nr:DUF3467 domain-containing protein [Endomicrobiaceae bacterium]MDD3053385.1 DUF3467 domain-containing protein [Endomicrobiaceae bacterium]MDD5102489.1 DUF3467 domain-containing protein [Endomicrobiaceae bacterium]